MQYYHLLKDFYTAIVTKVLSYGMAGYGKSC